MFDIKPVDESGSIDVNKICNLQTVLNLGRKFRINNSRTITSVKNNFTVKNRKERFTKEKSKNNLIYHTEYQESAPDPKSEFENFLNKDLDVVIELASIGAEFHGKKYFKPRPKAGIKYSVLSIDEEESEDNNFEPEYKIPNIKYGPPTKDYEKILRQINEKLPPVKNSLLVGEPKKIDAFSLGILTLKTPQEVPASSELKEWVDDFSKKSSDFSQKKTEFPDIKIPKISRIWLVIAGIGLISLTAFSRYGSSLKNQLIVESNSAMASLQSAGENIKKMDFVSASGDFEQAYQEFSKAGDNLNFMGERLSSLLSDLPGAGKLKSAKNLVEAGKLMADAGQSMSDAMGEIAKTNLILNPFSPPAGGPGKDISIGEISASFKTALTVSKKNLGKAGQLLSDIDDSSLPEDKKASFNEFRSKLPVFEKLVNDAADYSKFLEDFIGTKGTKKYLVLFQNPSELRPTGGFPGTYGVVSFKDGKLQNFKVDDVYNLDGQLQELIIPPIQLQHITPNWGMRDANWFVDFPTSAVKMSSFFKKEAGYDVDGVVTFSPEIVAKILEIVGPVEMLEYDLTLDAKNLFSVLQDQVEYKGDRKQPKQIVMDLAPKMLKKLYSADSGKWLEVFNVLVSSMEQKDILMYFRDLNLEGFSADKGFSGQVKKTESDYLMATFTNIKGSKTDLVIDSSLKMQITVENGEVKHRLSITRTHNGGNSEYGFYNKQNPAYVRVLVPDNAEFLNLKGNSKPDFKALINYADSGFKKDDDLAKFEEGSYADKETGVTIYKEAGKTEFGFWMIVDPSETKTVDLEYSVPSSGKDYRFYIQKQPGLDIKDFKFLIDGQSYFDGPLEKDMVISSR